MPFSVIWHYILLVVLMQRHFRTNFQQIGSRKAAFLGTCFSNLRAREPLVAYKI
jgi:hypothetical protein